MREYPVSKLCNVLFSAEIGRRLDGKGTTSRCTPAWSGLRHLAAGCRGRCAARDQAGCSPFPRPRRHCTAHLAGAGAGHGRYYDTCAEREASGVATPELARFAVGPQRGLDHSLSWAYGSSCQPAGGADACPTHDSIRAGDYVFGRSGTASGRSSFPTATRSRSAARNERPDDALFPELVACIKAELPERCVIDGEIGDPRRRGRRAGLRLAALRIHRRPAGSSCSPPRTGATSSRSDCSRWGIPTNGNGRSAGAGPRLEGALRRRGSSVHLTRRPLTGSRRRLV